MDFVKPAEMAKTMSDAGVLRAELPVRDMIVRGMMAGALLGIATSLALTAAVQTGVPLVGAIVFPVGFVMIVCLGLELCTGNFGILALSFMEGRIGLAPMMRNFAWGFLGNLIGSLLYALLLVIALTNFWHTGADANPVAKKIVEIAQAKTTAYEAIGSAGLITAFVKAMLCNWMVCLGVTMSMMSTSTFGKILGAWLPILLFFAQGFEHAVVNMFMIPAGMMLGAPVSFEQWWAWNQIPVTLGNFVGGVLFISLAWYLTYRPQAVRRHAEAPTSAAVATR
ncbi:formate/nitrite transporter family protein [Methylorubrum salsuginis]|uniref:Formate/nitrite transporter n=1 Tax=Methylorubrum salsuginis TaxID=414703 RepID=A0A1I4G079_9HYPH|nr:formate/nitrite transporter family protein [Methylorubrum salsuginis]SFL23119.1 formate/nitrite transporter [Methylorubrum salsuginis]